MSNTYTIDYSRQTAIHPGNFYVLLMPFSEVCDHMRIAGTVQHVEVRDNGVYLDGGKGPHITYGEAGIYEQRDDHPLFGNQHPLIRRWAYGMKLASDE
jgi:hypothetical protein